MCREEERAEKSGLPPIYSIGLELVAELPDPMMWPDVVSSHTTLSPDIWSKDIPRLRDAIVSQLVIEILESK